jgi:hypothetical protein
MGSKLLPLQHQLLSGTDFFIAGRRPGVHHGIMMKTLLSALCLILIVAVSGRAGSADQDKAFTEKYKKAFEGKDTATLESFLYTKGADPAAVEFYKMMQSSDAGGKVTKIELVALTPEEAAKASEPQDSPNGKACLTLKPTKKLVIAVETKGADGSSTSESQNFVAEKDGKLLIPVPGPCK